MTPDEFLDKQYHLSVTAGMNQRYHQNRSHLWACCNRAVQILVAVLAILGVCFSVAALQAKSEGIDIAAIAIASSAAFFAVALNVLPLGDWAANHADLLRRWTDFREDIDALSFDIADEVTEELKFALRQMDAKAHRICGSEPKPKERLLRRCYDDEVRSREFAPVPERPEPTAA